MDLPQILGLALDDLDVDHAQEVLAQRMGVSQSTVSKWKHALRSPRPESWQAIAWSTGRSRDEIAAAVGRTVLKKKEKRQPDEDVPVPFDRDEAVVQLVTQIKVRLDNLMRLAIDARRQAGLWRPGDES